MPEPREAQTRSGYFPLGFQLSRKAEEWLDARALVAQAAHDPARGVNYGARALALRLNEKRLRSSLPFEPIQAGELITLGVVDDILRYVVSYYCCQANPGVMARGLQAIARQRGPAVAEQPPPAFVNLFPPEAIHETGWTVGDFLHGDSLTECELPAPNREIVAGEMILLALSIANPAMRPFRTLFDDDDLRKAAPYVPLIGGLETFFAQQPALPETGETLFEALRAPMLACPDSLEAQLRFMLQRWAAFLPQRLVGRASVAANILQEERHMRGFGPGEVPVLEFGKSRLADVEYAAFSPDRDWMSNVVLMAKSVYVWLDQLAKRYGRSIDRLDQVPDEELDRLSRWGFTGLWLIGLWQRSSASQRIKQMMGNPEAAPSAYSLYDYVIADDLGGEGSYQNLRERAWRRGIRLASDMVPNHMGIYSQWVVEHPEWFLQLDYPPYPVYSFTGANLSADSRVELRIEDGYWERRDAAVVFQRRDAWSGETRYIYHGNDGTNMPWNDTAQLNFLLPEVREAVIQTILHVARKFPIIRFDAAMTLAKRHYKRLWFPMGEEGGAVPSRAEHGMTKEQFDEAFPKEFWREVVDRVAAEAPDTLLLAEAFWLMEGYFVRTLGMHRVYNSAFMNMLKMEDNAKYRQTVKNVLEFSPQVLKRFVNFMNNPDEETAVAQFGRGDKHFGVAVLLATMPGLPMFGHGQIEGLTEKYGMEYRRAYWDEQPDGEMVRRYENEVFPLMRRRKLFSGAENFALYDFFTPHGWVDENVFAYSNRANGERALIVYNNVYATTSGWIHRSTAINVAGDDEPPQLVQRTLTEALGLRDDDHIYYAFREHQSGLEFLRPAKQVAEQGLFVTLAGYQHQAFLDFRELPDADGSWAELARRLGGQGTPSVEAAYREMRLDPILVPFRELLAADRLRRLAVGAVGARDEAVRALAPFFAAARGFANAAAPVEPIAQAAATDVAAALARWTPPHKRETAKTADGAPTVDWEASTQPPLLAWAVLRRVGFLRAADDETPPAVLARRRLDEWLLATAVTEALRAIGREPVAARADALLVALLISHEKLLAAPTPTGPTLGALVRELFADPAAQDFLQFNTHEGVEYLNKELLDRLLDALAAAATILGTEDAAARADAIRQAATAAGFATKQITLAPGAD